ncbi:hypothetical protein PsYK624_133570 [Phanerochaete sordida]|uniref:Uncharacterized protein n=1 Tax=Phanerochaete sordida TaxID=48140 RepID=A0A9P3GKW6_9APHY|nr:hypothetical protein PsYK624_133570 [Phanerochaete sordida]
MIYLDVQHVALGIPKAGKFWTPILDESIPLHLHVPFFANWITSYFTQGNFSRFGTSTLGCEAQELLVPKTAKRSMPGPLQGSRPPSGTHLGLS